jgi:hypothetical protein
MSLSIGSKYNVKDFMIDVKLGVAENTISLPDIDLIILMIESVEYSSL